jgi:hypothetical protein
MVSVNISYVVRTTNNLFNRVYPFYVLEGAGTVIGMGAEKEYDEKRT